MTQRDDAAEALDKAVTAAVERAGARSERDQLVADFARVVVEEATLALFEGVGEAFERPFTIDDVKAAFERARRPRPSDILRRPLGRAP